MPEIVKDPLLASLQSQPIRPDAPLKAGQRVLAEWNGGVYPAKILRVLKDGRVKISYEDYDSSWDEAVARGRLRALAVEPRTVTIHIAGAPAQTGVIVARLGEFFDITRSNDGRRVLVNARSVAAIEVHEFHEVAAIEGREPAPSGQDDFIFE